MKLYGASLPLVIACTGHALAGGSLLVLTGDVRIRTAGPFRIGLNEVAIGLPVPVLAMSSRATASSAPSCRARRSWHRSRRFRRRRVKAGYLDEVVPAERLLDCAKEEATRLTGLARPAFKATKSRLRGRTIAHILGTLEDDMRTRPAPPA